MTGSEVNAVRSLHHRSIIQYIEAGITRGGKPYLLMPLVDGDDIVTAARAASSPTEVVSLFREVLAGLEYAHSLGVIHRDLKPSNILVRNSDKQPIVLDFGAAYVLDEITSKSLTTHVVGTAGYIPQEVMLDPKNRDPKQDVFAMGIILYEVFAGRQPDVTDYRPLEDIDRALAPLDSPIRDAIAGASRRTSSSADFRSALADALGTGA